MEDERSTQSYQGAEADQVEVTDRGLLGNLLGKKKEEEDKKKEEELVTGMEKVSVEEPEVKEDGEKKETLFSKLHRSSSSSSSSSDEEEEEEVIDENGEVIKRKKKKGLKEKLKEKLPGHKDNEAEHVTGLPAPMAPASVQTHHDTDVVVEKIDGDAKTEATPAVPEEEKKGFLEKIKEKLPGGHKKPEDAAAVPVTHAAPAPVHAPAPAAEEVSSPDAKEKKGLLGKIMDKLPGYHKTGEEDKAAAPSGEHKPRA
uniref:Dehydrin 8 n=1 Tax=Hordeum vulgare TaxID=4513 RepID=Q9SBI8_HORVU|nr:dehydrin 8 [Hordeum vulgare subsp. vulgare]